MSTAIEKIKTKPLTQVTNVKELLWNDAAKTQLQQVAAAHMKPERMMRLMANAIRTTPKLGVPSRMITLTLAVGPFLLQDGF